MTNFINNELHRITLAAFGAVLLTTTFVGAAVAPARAIETDASVRIAAATAGPVRA